MMTMDRQMIQYIREKMNNIESRVDELNEQICDLEVGCPEEEENWPTGINDLDRNAKFNVKEDSARYAFRTLILLEQEMNDEHSWGRHFDSNKAKWTVSINAEGEPYPHEVGHYSIEPVMFKTRKMAEFSAKHHEDLWRDFYQISDR